MFEVPRHRNPSRSRRAPLATLAALACLVLPAAALAQGGGVLPPSDPTGQPGGSTPTPSPEPEPVQSPKRSTVLDGSGMWIWYVRRSHAGSYAAIAAQARKYKVRTLFIKSSDSGNWWSQFNPGLISYFHARGMRVCAWQYVYGRIPTTEANLGGRAVRTGADCLVIDAESEYEGRYPSASTYIRRLRAQIGPSFPLALAGFPYVDFHPSFPYSVFLGPGGAQYNQPQMYWHTIGTSVDRVFSHTYTWNVPYRRPIFPLGQTYDRPPIADIRRFRKVAQAYGATGVSWWVWQQSTAAGWRAVGASLQPLEGYRPSSVYPTLRRGSKGDLVVWAQQYLNGAGNTVPITGIFGVQTDRAVRDYQLDHGLAVDGRIGRGTWIALLQEPPKPVRWTGRPGFARSSSTRGRELVLGSPRSASLPARRYEIPPKR
jgi:hypothetical protein